MYGVLVLRSTVVVVFDVQASLVARPDAGVRAARPGRLAAVRRRHRRSKRRALDRLRGARGERRVRGDLDAAGSASQPSRDARRRSTDCHGAAEREGRLDAFEADPDPASHTAAVPASPRTPRRQLTSRTHRNGAGLRLGSGSRF
ncbi:unnamed protein product [Penicillium discolor]